MSQPIDEVYPSYNPVIKSQPDSAHSDGSYGPVFIVLAVIFVIGVAACVLGRLCSRRRHRDNGRPHHHHQVHHQPPPKSNAAHEQSHGLGPKEWEAREKPRIALRERADIEFGLDKRIPSDRVGSHGGGMAAPPPQFDGGRRPEVRFADNV